MRKLVTPAHPQASIPDPDRGGFLPPEGRVVLWTPHWAGMLAREEITVAAAPDEAAEPAAEPAAETAAETAAEPEPSAEASPAT